MEKHQLNVMWGVYNFILHMTVAPTARSALNTSDRWRRGVALRYASAGAGSRFGQNVYADWRDGAPFAREYLLVAGRDVHGRGFRRLGPSRPLVGTAGEGYTGEKGELEEWQARQTFSRRPRLTPSGARPKL